MLRLSKRRLVLSLAALLPLAVLVPVSASSASQSTPPTACSSDLVVPAPPGAQVESVTAVQQPGGTITFPAQPPLPAPDPVSGVPAYCEITVTLTHPGAGDHARVKVWAPVENWSGRFLAAGGSAYAAA